MNKRALIGKFIAKLAEELEVYYRAAQASRSEATDEQNKAENKYDTRGLEASYLARGQSKQAAEVEEAIHAFEGLDPRPFESGESIDVGALIELENDQDGERFLTFLAPKGGGTEVIHEEQEVLVITPQSPLGEHLVGMQAGQPFQLTLAGVAKSYRILSVA